MRLLLVLAVVLGVVCGDMAPSEKLYKILMLLPAGSTSHRNVFMPLAEALADRGHKVVMVVNQPPSAKHRNIMEIHHGLLEFGEENFNMFDARNNPDEDFDVFKDLLVSMARKLYQVPSIKELFGKRKKFDLVIIDNLFNELAYPFAAGLPLMTLAPAGLDERQSAVLGNVLNPAYVSSIMHEYQTPLTFTDRLYNLAGHVFYAVYWRHWKIVPYLQEEISSQFPDLPPLLDIERQQSVQLLNSYFVMDDPRPLLPSQVEVGGMHCRPARPLPEDLESWIAGAGEAGVVYFSLGSVTKGVFMPKHYTDLFLEAFSKLDQRVVWKYEEELDVPGNVLLVDWLPQQDILAHPNVRVFISHAGHMSSQETFYHGTPVLAIPIFYDQHKNALSIVRNGLGLSLVWEELTVDVILNALQEIINNPKYQLQAEEVSRSIQDQLESPLERAVFWTEYVIRHRGAPRLRSPATQLSWVEYLMLDVLLLLQVALYLTYRLVWWILRRLFTKNVGVGESKDKME